jgi:hypothetical protein
MRAEPGHRLHVRELMRRPALLLWCAGLMLMPFYVMSGGLPQPSDAVALLLVPIALAGWNGRLNGPSMRAFRPLLWFTAWVCIVDFAWAVILWKFNLGLLFPLYYVYNTALFLTALVLYQRFGERFLRWTVHTVFISLWLQCAFSVVYARHGRSALFFDNPNQLGYYALLVACIIALMHRRLGLRVAKSAAGLTGAGYLAILSGSRSAVAGIALLVVLLMFQNPRLIILATAAAIALSFIGGPVESSVDALQARLTETRNPQLNFFEQRGYDRIWSNKQYLFTGAGEGNTMRFAETTAIGPAEIHSSAGTVLFAYGFIGVWLFLAFLWQLVRGMKKQTALMLLPPMLYTVAHQGLRFTMLWVLLALFVALKGPPLVKKTNPVPARAR